MTAQFDIIHERWNLVNRLPNYRACQANAEVHIKALISQGATRILDLGCGTGHYSRLCLDYGAKQVVGVDLSQGMIGNAAAISRDEGYPTGTDLKFRIGDARECRVWNGGEYDIVLGMWLCCFARDQAELTAMFQTISVNLKPGGTFIGCQFKQSSEPAQTVDMYDEAYIENFGQSATVNSEAIDGIELRLTAHIGPDPVEFDCYSLKSSTFRSAAMTAGMDMVTFEFHPPKIPADLRKEYAKGVFEDEYGRSRANFSILLVKKKKLIGTG